MLQFSAFLLYLLSSATVSSGRHAWKLTAPRSIVTIRDISTDFPRTREPGRPPSTRRIVLVADKTVSLGRQVFGPVSMQKCHLLMPVWLSLANWRSQTSESDDDPITQPSGEKRCSPNVRQSMVSICFSLELSPFHRVPVVGGMNWYRLLSDRQTMSSTPVKDPRNKTTSARSGVWVPSMATAESQRRKTGRNCRC